MRNRITYGYKISDGEIRTDENQREIVLKIFESYLEGNSIRQVMQELNEAGIPSPNGKPWVHGAVGNVLENNRYAGENQYPAIISKEMFEAAEIDGATKFQRAIYLIIPLVKPTTLYLTVTQVINMLKLFVIVQLLTDGGPNNASMTMMYYLYRNAFKYDKTNTAAAIGVLMFIFALIITLPQFQTLAGIEPKKKAKK